MGQVIDEGLRYIGSINDDGYVFDRTGNRIAQINDSGYITKVAGGKVVGKIDEDGTIRDASLDVVGRIQADGYVYIHGNRVCKVSSKFIENITPKAWNAGSPSSYQGRQKSVNYSAPAEDSFFTSPFFIKVVIGFILGIVGMASGWGGIELLLAGPILVPLFCFIASLFN